MKRLLFLFLLTVCSPSWAEWVHISTVENIEFYYEDKSIRRNGEVSKMWTLFSGLNDSIEGKNYQSFSRLYSYDCKNEVTKVLRIVFYSGVVSQGKVVFSHEYKNDNWVSVRPGTLEGKALEIACSAK
jgi:hypothetical protein